MTGRPTLAGLDDIDWAALTHAYGQAEDIPELLRQLAVVGLEGDAENEADEEDEDEAEEILDELWSSICHQGSVYSATIAAAPFLAEIAAAGVATTGTLHLLGSIAEAAEAADPRATGGADPLRAAVSGCFDVLAPLLESPDSEVLEAVIFVLAHGGLTERVRPLLVARWNTEADPGMRAEILHALVRVDSALAADLADEILDSSSTDNALLRVSAARAWIHAGRALEERVLAAAMTPIPEDGPDLSRWCAGGDLFGLIINEIVEYHGTPVATDFLARTLIAAQGGPDDVTEQRLEAARELIMTSRSAAVPLIEPITNFLGYPALRSSVFGLLTMIGPPAFTPRVREHLLALSRGPDPSADDALTYLFQFDDPIAPSLLARDLADRPRTLSVASGALARLEPGHVAVPFNAELLTAIRRRLAELAHEAGRGIPEDEDLIASMRRTNEPIQLARILGAWNEAAAPATPELARMLPISTMSAARALAAIHPRQPQTSETEPGSGADAAAAVAALRKFSDCGDPTARIAVAEAIRALTDNSGPLLDAVLSILSIDTGSGPDRTHDELRAAAKAAASLPGHAATLVPRLTEALPANSPSPVPSLPAHGARIELVSTLHRLTGESDEAIPVLREALTFTGEFLTSWTVAEAADVAATLGAAARDLLPEIESALEDKIASPAAAQALLTIDPEGDWATSKREQLARHLISTLTDSRAPRAHQRALDVLTALAPALPPAATEALRELADRDERILAALPDAELVRADEIARARIRALLTR